MLRFLFMLWVCILQACSTQQNLALPGRPANAISGTEFYNQVIGLPRQEREDLAMAEFIKGNAPDFLRQLVIIRASITDSSGNLHKAEYFVTPDYLSIGSNQDWARIPLTPMTAQKIADAFDCFLPTRKMVNDIYQAAKLRLAPVPLYALRDSSVIFWHHHLIIEGQRKARKGLIAGIKKDVVISEKVTRDIKSNRVAIYGWHKPDGIPIQPLYTGHVDWYVDYSHGIRLVYRKIKVDGKWMDYIDVLKNPDLRPLLCDETFCDFYKYPY